MPPSRCGAPSSMVLEPTWDVSSFIRPYHPREKRRPTRGKREGAVVGEGRGERVVELEPEGTSWYAANQLPPPPPPGWRGGKGLGAEGVEKKE